jgi:1-acyl-sn-glycerol-3-phosphate acyltransferase
VLPEGASPRLHDVARWIAGWVFRPAYRLRVLGLSRVPLSGQVVLVANHSTMVEPPVIFGSLPRRSVFLVKRELISGAVGWALQRIGQLPVRRGAPDRTALTAAVRVLRSGGVLGVFPEGTRGSGDVSHAEQGAAWLVRTTGAVVLPIATRGTLRPSGSGRRFRRRVARRAGCGVARADDRRGGAADRDARHAAAVGERPEVPA